MSRILVIDDNELYRKALESMIVSRLPEATIKGASDNREGLKTAETFRPHMVLVDIHPMDAGGQAIAKTIKALNQDTVIIGFTDYDLPEYRAAMAECGIGYSIPKDTWSGEDILRLIESLLPEPPIA